MLRSGWYRLPAKDQRDKAGPLLVISAAGRFDPREVQLQWATDDGAASGHPGGSAQFADVGASPAWRNLRLPLSVIPSTATQVRLVVNDEDLAPQHWIAVTPPRIPQLRTLQDVVGSTGPGVPGLAGRSGVPVPAPVRPSKRRRRNTEMAHPAGPVRRRGQLPGDGQQRRRAAGYHRVAGEGDHGGQLPERRLVPGLGRAATADAVLPQRPARPSRAWNGHAQRAMEPGAAAA